MKEPYPYSDSAVESIDENDCSAVISPDRCSELKLEINRLVWTYSPESITLGQADELSCKVLNSIMRGKYLT